MNAPGGFFYQTYYLWVVSRVIIIILGITSLSQVFRERYVHAPERIINLLFIIYLLLMIIAFVREISGRRGRNLLNKVTGILSIITGIALITIAIILRAKFLPLAFLLSLWFVLLGLFDWARNLQPASQDIE